ncbi:uncharacterized protein LOC119981444 isoform X1 [Tripterygium wilfordii]|uniref:uncharacterized protein LOC119981444 isoform X1 n=1 Tax=Tripterygium wilfordii TaxID=458696 RepID=UPI0018F862E2|nr:uncharacterized protein LOC119981444 isoform X1 [Tripterygium wilfordii]
MNPFPKFKRVISSYVGNGFMEPIRLAFESGANCFAEEIDHSVEARIERLKKDVAEIGEEQRCIREGQREVKKKIETIRSNCAQLRRETQLMCMQSTIFNHKLNIMLQIMHARKRGDVDKAQKLTQFLFDDRFS